VRNVPIARTAVIPGQLPAVSLRISNYTVKLTNLDKVFWPGLKLTKRDLLNYYAGIAPWLLPHLKNRAMVMKRYPNGISGEFFFMKRAPEPHPEFIAICSIKHHSGNVIGFPMVENLSALLWLINLGCIDLNPWYSRCDDVDRPDFLNFDLDPTDGATFNDVLQAALLVRSSLATLKIKGYPKTTGSRGIHLYVPIVRGPSQKQVWRFAKAFAQELAARFPRLVTAEYRIAKRPRKRILVDYNQNAWNRTLASVYSVRPTPTATVSVPLRWEEIERGVQMAEFTLQTVPARVKKLGDLWKPLLAKTGRLDLGIFL
jgi:bifunctional non-homologous end joining protein LigD